MMTPEAVDRFTAAAAAYVHIPFCAAVCPYCDFAVVAGQDHLAGRYVDAVLAEISRSEPWRPLDAVYFGGGTPSHLEPKVLGQILGALEKRHGIGDGAEISLEANPEDFTPGHADALHRLGFDRVSFGAQSFDPAVLTVLGRRHGPEHIAGSVASARVAGFDNISLDLIYGTPGESDESWAATLAQAVALAPEHLSCYALTVERGTPLSRSVGRGAPAPDPDVQADRYLQADQALEEAGYFRYETSNWSRPGHECRYNLIVWAQGEYEAYGNGAHRFRDGTRSRNIRRLDAYIRTVEEGELPTAGAEALGGWDLELDRLFVGLRRTVGVVAGAGGKALLGSDPGRRLLDAGVLAVSDGRLAVAEPLLGDEVNRAILGLTEPEQPPVVDNV